MELFLLNYKKLVNIVVYDCFDYGNHTIRNSYLFSLFFRLFAMSSRFLPNSMRDSGYKNKDNINRAGFKRFSHFITLLRPLFWCPRLQDLSICFQRFRYLEPSSHGDIICKIDV